MTNALIVQLRDDVVKQLNKKQGGWSERFQAKAFYTPKPNLEDLDQLKCLVAMADTRISADNRTDWEHEYDIDIGILFRAGPKTGDQATTRFDSCMLLVQQICDYWLETRPEVADCPLNAEQPITFPHGIYLQSHIETLNQFTSVMRLTFWKLRDV